MFIHSKPLLKSYFFAYFLGMVIISIDFLTKFYIHSTLPPMNGYYVYPYGGMGIFKDFLGIEFSITHATNLGAAWGMLAEWQEVLLYLRILLVVGLIIYVLRFNKDQKYQTPLLCITAGAIGNIMDYFLYGHVVDMFHFILWGYDYPVFNIADSAIFLGLAWLFLLEIFNRKQSRTQT